MGGPMAYLAPGYRSHTAWAMTWAVECRSTRSPSGSEAVTGSTLTSTVTGHERSTSSPSTLAQMAPVGTTADNGVPASTSFTDPSESDTFGIAHDDRAEEWAPTGSLRAVPPDLLYQPLLPR